MTRVTGIEMTRIEMVSDGDEGEGEGERKRGGVSRARARVRSEGEGDEGEGERKGGGVSRARARVWVFRLILRVPGQSSTSPASVRGRPVAHHKHHEPDGLTPTMIVATSAVTLALGPSRRFTRPDQ
eukprot:763241-Hanusia_phi.AAC.5